MDSCVIKPAPLLALQPGCLHRPSIMGQDLQKGKKVILEHGKSGGSSGNRVERRVIKNHEFLFDVDDSESDKIEVSIHKTAGAKVPPQKQPSETKVSFEEDLFKLTESDTMLVNLNDVNPISSKLLKMATTRTMSKKVSSATMKKKKNFVGVDVNQVLSQLSKKEKVSTGKHEIFLTRSKQTLMDFFEAPLGSYEIGMHSIKDKSDGKKGTQNDKSSSTPTDKYDFVPIKYVSKKDNLTKPQGTQGLSVTQDPDSTTGASVTSGPTTTQDDTTLVTTQESDSQGVKKTGSTGHLFDQKKRKPFIPCEPIDVDPYAPIFAKKREA
jgi:hypothetical protein